MALALRGFLANLLQANALRKFTDSGVLGRGECRTGPKPALQPPQTGDSPRIRPVSRRRMDTGKVSAGGRGRVAVIAWLSDSTAVGRGQAGSEVGEAPAMATIRKPPHRCARTPAMTIPTTTSLLPFRWQPAAAPGPHRFSQWIHS